MRISAKADYAVRAVIELAAVPDGVCLNAREIARAQDIPQNFLENILAELRRAGIVHTQRGPGGGSTLARPASAITVAQILLAVDGPLAAVRDLAPEQLVYEGAARNLPALSCRMHACIGELLDGSPSPTSRPPARPPSKYDLTGHILLLPSEPMPPAAPVMNDPWGELSRLSFDEGCRTS
jgi:Rrf2 family protein